MKATVRRPPSWANLLDQDFEAPAGEPASRVCPSRTAIAYVICVGQEA